MDGNAPEGFHVVLTTHNSRTSQRMRDRGIRPGPALLLPLDHEILLTQCIADVILESGFRCISYNICRDHVHMIIVCQHVQLVKVMQKIKSVLSKKFRRQLRERSRPMGHDGPMGHDPLGGVSASPRDAHHALAHDHLWSQKFYRADLDVWTLHTLSNLPGYLYKTTHLENALHYILYNREKHKLPYSEKLNVIIDNFRMRQEDAFRAKC